jgi:hypothetical protein
VARLILAIRSGRIIPVVFIAFTDREALERGAAARSRFLRHRYVRQGPPGVRLPPSSQPASASLSADASRRSPAVHEAHASLDWRRPGQIPHGADVAGAMLVGLRHVPERLAHPAQEGSGYSDSRGIPGVILGITPIEVYPREAIKSCQWIATFDGGKPSGSKNGSVSHATRIEREGGRSDCRRLVLARHCSPWLSG